MIVIWAAAPGVAAARAPTAPPPARPDPRRHPRNSCPAAVVRVVSASAPRPGVFTVAQADERGAVIVPRMNAMASSKCLAILLTVMLTPSSLSRSRTARNTLLTVAERTPGSHRRH